MKSGYFFLLSLLGMLSLGCSRGDIGARAQYQPKFVVEGSISLGGFPTVALTHNLPVSIPIDSSRLEEIIIRWAKVEVFSEDDHEVLTLVKTANGFPFYHYVGRTLRGREGVDYHLRITYADELIEATTTIPAMPKIDKLSFSEAGDSVRLLQLSFTDPADSKDFYRFYGKLKGEPHYASFTPSGFSDELANGQPVSLRLFRNRTSNISPDVDMYYKIGDTVQIRLVTMPEDAFVFWKQVNGLTGQLPSLGSPVRIEGNVSGPALGIWYGEAYDEATAIIN